MPEETVKILCKDVGIEGHFHKPKSACDNSNPGTAEGNRDFARVTWYLSNRNHAAILHARSNTMAATQRERVPSLRGYRDSLSAENRQMYDDKLKFTAGIDPYAVNDNFYSQSMDE